MNDSGKAVVFLHGIGGAARIWTLQEQSFRRAGFRPVALDFLGYGARDPVDVLDCAGLAQDVETSVDRLGLVRPFVVGHSLGGMVAQTMLRRRPQGYRAVVLAAGNAVGGYVVTERMLKMFVSSGKKKKEH